MKSTDTALFTNSCGRIFADRIQLASYKGEATVQVREISHLKFKTSITRNGFLFSLLPSILIGIAVVINPVNVTERALFFLAGIIGIAALLYMAERKHIIRITYKRGAPRDISVLSANVKEAKKYVAAANSVVTAYHSKKKTSAAENTRINVLATNV